MLRLRSDGRFYRNAAVQHASHNVCFSSHLTLWTVAPMYGSSAAAGRGDLQSKIAPRNQTLSAVFLCTATAPRRNTNGKLRAYIDRSSAARARHDGPRLLHVLLTHPSP
jgi:hypothetical protein